MVLHGGNQHVITLLKIRAAPGLGEEIHGRGRAAGPDQFFMAWGIDERGNALSSGFVAIRRLVAEFMYRAVHVGGAVRVVFIRGIEYGLGLWGRGGAVEVDQRLVVNLSAEQRELGAEGLHVKGVR